MANTKSKGKWIQSVVAKHPGSLTLAAKEAGMSLDQFCAQTNLSTKNQRRCNLRKILMNFKKK